MQIEIKIDATVTEPKVIVLTNKMSREIDEIVRKISEQEPNMLVGFQNDTATVIDPADIFHCYSADGKVYACTKSETYQLKLRLYELEEKLVGSTFVRVSNSDIINLKKVRRFDLSIGGTICVQLHNDTCVFVSRRFVSKIKKTLGI